jgi:hypothetical protein
LGVEEDASHFHVCAVFLELKFCQLYLLGASSDACPLGAPLFFCQMRVAMDDPSHCRLEPFCLVVAVGGARRVPGPNFQQFDFAIFFI